MRGLDLDLIALPGIPEHLEITDKVPPRGIDLAELCCVLENGVAERDTPVARREG